MSTDQEHLTWIRNRLIKLENANPKIDYIVRLDSIIASVGTKKREYALYELIGEELRQQLLEVSAKNQRLSSFLLKVLDDEKAWTLREAYELVKEFHTQSLALHDADVIESAIATSFVSFRMGEIEFLSPSEIVDKVIEEYETCLKRQVKELHNSVKEGK